MSSEQFTCAQLDRIEAAFRIGAEHASAAMAKWLSAPSVITIECVAQQPITDAVLTLSNSDDAVCFCIMAVNGSLTGHLILGFDDVSGLSLAGLVLHRRVGAASEWGEIEESAALETHNIIGCAYLNALATHLPGAGQVAMELVPSPPEFRRDFAESLLQSVFIGQATDSDLVFVAKAIFELLGAPLNWTLLFVPDAPSMETLRRCLANTAVVDEGAE